MIISIIHNADLFLKMHQYVEVHRLFSSNQEMIVFALTALISDLDLRKEYKIPITFPNSLPLYGISTQRNRKILYNLNQRIKEGPKKEVKLERGEKEKEEL